MWILSYWYIKYFCTLYIDDGQLDLMKHGIPTAVSTVTT